jgi:sugar (pentulose or hexulose) kinase
VDFSKAHSAAPLKMNPEGSELVRFLALDLGSSYTKCFVLEDGKCLENVQHPAAPVLQTIPTRFEVDAQAYYENVLSLLHDMCSLSTQGILLSTQMHGFVLTDERFHPITPYVSWQDRACTEISPAGESWRETLLKQLNLSAFADSGVPLKESLALCNLFARMKTGLSIPDGTRLCTLGGYIIGRLTGRHVCHISNAGPLGLMDMKRGRWNESVITSAGMERLKLPELLTSLDPCGEAVLLGRRMALYPDIGDQQVCTLGASIEPETGLHVNIGTAGLIGTVCEKWRDGSFENRTWFLPGHYLRTVSGLPGGRDIQKVEAFLARRDGLEEAVAWERMCAARCDAPPPIRWDMADTEATLAALPARYTLEETACSFYREMAVRYALAANGMMDAVTSIRFSGGCALKNPALRRAILEQFPRVSPQDDMLKDVTFGMEALLHSVQTRTEK